MNIKVIYSSGGKYNKERQQKIADNETTDGVNGVAKALACSGHKVDIVKITPTNIADVNKIHKSVVFNLVEWSGKDYPLAVKVLKILERNHTPFTGAGSKVYEWGSNKITMKKMFDRYKIPSPSWTSITPITTKKTIAKKIKPLTLPIIIKPAYEHCAIGISLKSVVNSEKDAINEISKLLKKYKEPVIAENYIDGREFTTTVIGNKRLHIFPPAEVIFKTTKTSKILSFNRKWLEGVNAFNSIIVKDKNLAKNLKNLSKKTFLKTGCKSYVRIDFRMGKGKLYVLEINVNPSIWPEKCYGLTVSTEADGWTFAKLVEEITQSALQVNLTR